MKGKQMGDTFAEVEAGLALAAKWLPQLLQLFGMLTQRGVPPQQAAQMISDHITPGKPNIDG